jgi:hypothetical protein
MRKPVYTIKGCNEIRLYEDYAVLVVPYDETEKEYIIDIEDADRIKDYRWYYQINRDYCKCGTTGVPILPKFIMNLCTEDKSTVDYIDGNKYNCRKSNLVIRDSNKNEASVFAPVIEEPEHNNTNLLKTVNGEYVIVLENNQCMVLTEEEIKNKLFKAFDSNPDIFLEILR